MEVCVMGAGIVGLASAYALRQAGHAVTVVDRGPAGNGASGGNGAQLSYSYVQPLADPSIWRQLPQLLMSTDSPLKLRPRLDPAQWRWGLAFLAACNASTSRASTAALLDLAARSREAFDAMLLRERLDCDFSATGKLVLYPTAEAFAAARRQLALQRALGSAVQHAVSAAECVAIEPALAHYQGRIAGAIHTPSECAADCRKTCDGLHQVLRAQGVRFELGTEVRGFVQRADAVVALVTARGDLPADAFVLALGPQTPRLARQLGLRLPIYPLKGYSVTLPVGQAAAPRVSVTDSARKTVFARLGDRLRVAGMAELVGEDLRIAPERIATLLASTEALFPGCAAVPDPRPWAGLRPATPTGLPIVGRQPGGPSNLWVNSGHGALGFTLAFGTAVQLCEDLGKG
ncbi:D-amino acid dehydrogenase [Pseudorhodoferax sp. Leaf267]|uniref:D-amino acid dehydrogenase n=1 Tax=Pseudorhodoferax sp. Leaf267 TaxID=1736316 RepID=UPI000712875E|nr:D-amino acid dehydrogenase [Pseudorhodoferax sp. Leaf267]KQP20510.1 amino acid dehydrogenase [Pseudorhodoferax sp. Leaf267]